MIKEFYEQYMHIYGLAILCGVGILLKVSVSGIYSLLIRASDQMGTSKNKLMKVIRLKFETCYKLRIGVHNVETFADKYIYKYRFLGMLLSTWENLSSQVLILCMFCGTVGVIAALIYNAGRFAVWSTLFSAVMASIFLVTMDSIVNLEEKKRHLRINIVDYLDNYLKIRLQQEYMSDLFPKTVQVDKLEQRMRSVSRKPEENETDPGMEELVKSLLQDEQEIAAVKEETPKPKQKTTVKEEAPKSKQKTAVKEEAPKPEQKTAVKEETPKPKQKTTVKEETPKPEQKTTVKEEAPKPKQKTAVKEEALKPEQKEEADLEREAEENRIIAEVLQEYMA